MPRRARQFHGDPERDAEARLAKEERLMDDYSDETLAMEAEQYGYYGRPRRRPSRPTKGAKPFDEMAPFEFSRLYGNEKYSLNNMLLTEVNFPAEYFPEDTLLCVYSDRARLEWEIASDLLKSTSSGDAYFAYVDKDSLIKFANKLFDLINWPDFHNRVKFHEERLRNASGSAQIGENASARCAAEEAPEVYKFTGAAVIRFTHMSSGYPVLFIYAIKECDKRRRRGYPVKYVEHPDVYGRW